MIILLSPSKTQETGHRFSSYSIPQLLAKTEPLVDKLQRLSPAELASVMKTSDSLAERTWQRYQQFRLPPEPSFCSPALLAFRGDVFSEIGVDDYSEQEMQFAQDHVRIFSGLYGLLRPLDLIQPYRLEMGGAFKPADDTTLYHYWREDIEGAINELLAESGATELLNLASQEYFKVVRKAELKASVVTASFKEEKRGALRTVAIHAKRARGAMCDAIIHKRITRSRELRDFRYGDYLYNARLSTPEELVFVKKET